jgi:hypothetical protein
MFYFFLFSIIYSLFLLIIREKPFFNIKAVKRIRLTCLDYSRVEVAADARHRV